MISIFQLNDNYKKAIGGFASGIVNSTIFYPVDALRTRYFVKKDMPQNLSYLMNGIGFNTLTSGFKTMVSYGGQEFAKEEFLKLGYNQKYSQFYSSICTGLAFSVITTPINVIKVPLQTSAKTNVASVISHVYNKHGLGGFYRGGLPLALRDFSWAVSYFTMYGFVKNQCDEMMPTPHFYKQNEIISSLTSGVVSAAVAYPFDGMRLFRQYHKMDADTMAGFWESFKMTSSNIKSFKIGISRVTLSVFLNHISYLMIKDFLSYDVAKDQIKVENNKY